MARDDDLGMLSTWLDETTTDGEERRAQQTRAEETFARALRDRADVVAPAVPVRLENVVPRARRRRAAVRGAASLAAAAAAFGGVAMVQAHPWDPAAMAPVSPSGQTAPGNDTITLGQETTARDGTFWYVMTESRDAAGTEGTEVMESWSSLNEPGLLVWDRDPSTAAGKGPSDVIGRFRIDGEWVDMLRDPELLPSDPTALADVLWASVEADRGSGTDQEKVFAMARDLIAQGGLVPEALRRAAWEVAVALPGAEVADGEDSQARAGQVLEYTQDGAPVRLVWDPNQALLLEETSDGWSRTVLEQRFTDEPLPVQPTLENSGCVQWSTC